MEIFISRRDLIDSEALRQFSKKSNLLGITQLSSHLLLIVVTGYLVWATYGSWWIIPAWFAYGTALTFVFSPLHECIHRTAFQSRLLNSIVATVAGIILLLPANYFRHFHFEHHRHTNDVELDPELLTEKPSTIAEYVWAMTGLKSYWWPQICQIFKHCLGRVESKFIPKTEHRKIIAEARTHVALYFTVAGASIYFQNNFILIFWIVPVMFGMIALRLFLFAEHASCEISPNMLLNTRTTLTNSAVRMLTWNMPYHCEHHLFPAVPFHNLPQLHVQLKDKLRSVSPGYMKFHKEFFQNL